MSTRTGPPDRTAMVRRRRGERWFATTEPTWGRDEETGLEVQADPTGWLVDVRLTSVTATLRTSGGLLGAVQRALAATTGTHMAANAEQRHLAPAERDRARDLLSGRRRLEAERVPPPRPVRRPDGPLAAPRHLADERLTRTWSGSSRHGELRVVVTVQGLSQLHADEHVLADLDAATLRHLLREAFADAAGVPA